MFRHLQVDELPNLGHTDDHALLILRINDEVQRKFQTIEDEIDHEREISEIKQQELICISSEVM